MPTVLESLAAARGSPPRQLLLLVLWLLSAGLYAAVLPGQWLDLALDKQRFLGLHALLELLSIVISLTLGLTASYTLGGRGPHGPSLLMPAFLLVAVLDLLHVGSYAGMPDLFSANSSHKAILLWLLARFVAAMALLAWAADWLRDAGHGQALGRRRWALGLLTVVLVLGLGALLLPQQFPATFVPGEGLTPLKRGLEGLIVAINLAALWALRQRRGRGQARAGDADLRIALWLALLGEGFVVLYSDHVTDMANVIGHAYKLAAYAWLYRSLFIERVRQPFARARAAHVAAARREQEYRELLELAPDGVLVTDRDGGIVLVNQALERMFGRSRAELLGQPMELLLPERLRLRHRQHRSGYLRAPDGQAMRGRRGLKALHADGHEFDVEVALGLGQAGGEALLTAYITDVSLRRKQEQEIEYRAAHDALTGVFNRWRLDDELARAAATHQAMALAVLDLDGFKALNESQGSRVGDRVLRELASELGARLPPGGALARTGSDEFALLLPLQALADAGDFQARSAAATAWVQALVLSLQQGRGGAGKSVCAGLALAADASQSADLLSRAQLALQGAKGQGRAQLRVFSEALGERARRDARIEQRLRLALAEDTLALHYQPQIEAKHGHVQALEALLRWQDAELGSVQPTEFVPVAERAGLMPVLGDAVLRLACAQLAQWRGDGFATRVAINLSPRQFRDEALSERIIQALQRHRLPSHGLIVEVTESAMMDDPAAAASQLRRLAQAGIEAHLDDFGTGHSSLAWLKNFPIRVVKIDRSFVRDMLDRYSDDAIVRAVIGLAHTLGCTVIAEGVEQPAQMERLRALGCDAYQGWLFARALPPDEARRYCESRLHSGAAVFPR